MAEHTVWAIMTGGLLSLVLLAAIEALVTRSIGAVRSLLLIGAMSSVCVLLSGLPEALVPNLPQRLGMVLKAGLGPLVSALGLRLLGLWVGSNREDRLVHRITVWGSIGMLIASLVLMVLAALAPRAEYPQVLLKTAILNAIPVVLCLVVAVRATLRGDPLARWLVLACVILAGMVTGLYLRALDVEGFGLVTWIFTAAGAVLFMLITMVLIYLRNQDSRRLARLARLDSGNDPATDLPTGSRLMSEVEHAFWRTGRLRGKCVVVCVYLNNLYQLGDSIGRSVDNQILAATATRIRRVAGFRCVAGLYHPRCFIVVFSTDRKSAVNETALAHRFGGLVTQPLQVVGHNGKRQTFLPQVGISSLTVMPDRFQPQDVLNEVERQAMDQLRHQPKTDDQAETVW